MSFNGRFVLNIAQFASKHGADLNQLVKLSGLSAEELCQEDCKVDDKTYNRVLENAVKMSGDLLFGLHAGENMNLVAAGLIAQISQTSDTIREALDYCCEFANLGCSVLPMTLKDSILSLDPKKSWAIESSEAVRHTAEGVIAFTIREFQSLTTNDYHPLKIELPWKRPDSTKEYDRVLGCPTFFGKSKISIHFKPEHLEQKILSSDYKLLRVLVEHAEQRSRLLEREKGFSTIVRESILNLVKPEFPTIQQVAGHLNLSLRTFQRRLKDEGVTYKEIINKLREDMAYSYLKRSDLSIAEIAYLLSYSDASAFNRSFKGWTGQTPDQYRRTIGSTLV